MLLQGSHRPGKVLEFDLDLENSWNLKLPFVLEFCKITLENMNKSLKNIKIQLVLSDLWDAQKNCVKIAKKLSENR